MLLISQLHPRCARRGTSCPPPSSLRSPTLKVLCCILLAAGVCHGQYATTPAPSPVQIADDLLGTPAPTPLKCPDELAVVEACFSSQSDTQISQAQSGTQVTRETCEKCVVQYWPYPIDGCTTFVDGTCQGLAACDCGTCGPDVETYIQCLSECPVDCTPQPTASPAPTASMEPTIPNKCPDEYQAFNNCVDPTNGGTACETCLVALWPKPLQQCTDVTDVTCPGLAQCECNSCDSEWIDYLFCLTDGCPFKSCSNSTGPTDAAFTVSPAPTPHPCPDEQAAVRSCLSDAGVDASACSGCIQDSFPSVYSECNDIDEAICTGLAGCECGNCHAEILANVNCAFEAQFEKSCQVTCNGTNTLAPAAGPTTEGGSGATQCPDERSAYDQCVQNAQGAADECETCITGYWPETFNKCSEIKNGTCVGLDKCPCGSCQDTLLAFVQCFSGGCSLDCAVDSKGDGESAGDEGGGSSPSTTTSAAAAVGKTRFMADTVAGSAAVWLAYYVWLM